MLERMLPIAESKNISLAQLVLRWTINRPGITIALAGARNATQAIQNAGAAEVELTTEEMEFMKRQVESLEQETA
jgi:aryl-alcohol dehydrogenase-like predicted oxidoreductase